MARKTKKGSSKLANDCWENELGEDLSQNNVAQDANDSEETISARESKPEANRSEIKTKMKAKAKFISLSEESSSDDNDVENKSSNKAPSDTSKSSSLALLEDQINNHNYSTKNSVKEVDGYEAIKRQNISKKDRLENGKFMSRSSAERKDNLESELGISAKKKGSEVTNLEENPVVEPTIRLKTKKEKERERKEREKAARKVSATAATRKFGNEQMSVSELAQKKIDKSTEVVFNDASENSHNADRFSGTDFINANEEDQNVPNGEHDDSGIGQKSKSTKQNAKIEALRKMLERQKLEEERRKKEEEERQKIIAEEERQIEEAEKVRKEEKQRKAEKERAKREALKAQGKYLTKKQKEQKAQAEKRLEQMLQSGLIVAGLQQPEKGKKPVYDKRKPSEAKESVVKSHLPGFDSYNSEIIKSHAFNDQSSTLKQNVVAEEHDRQTPNEKTSLSDDKTLQEFEDEESSSQIQVSQISKPEYENWEGYLEDYSNVEEESPPGCQTVGRNVGIMDRILKENDGKSSKEISRVIKSEKGRIESGNTDLSQNSKTQPVSNKEVLVGRVEEDVKQSNLRSPICCIMGHVDTGKTKLLDNIRRTNVQDNEAGGITQQIGATYFPIENILRGIEVTNSQGLLEAKVPGLLIIDTPGHEAFSNLRVRGSSLCNMAILVIDIMHGLEQQTIESIQLLRERKTPFIVAFNKIDRLYEWQASENGSIESSLKNQSKLTIKEFQNRLKSIKLALAEQGLNSELYWKNCNAAKYVSIVPTSAITGEGVPNLLRLLVELTQTRLTKSLMFLSELQCTVLEVKMVEGLGTTVDVVLSNGVLNEGDKIVLCGLNGPIVSYIRALLTPQPMKEMRVKNEYIHHKSIKAAMGVKIAANDLEKAVAGSRLYVIGPNDDEEKIKKEAMEDLEDIMGSIDHNGMGVLVHASTLGSLEALLGFLKQMSVPVSAIGLGTVHRKDVMRATAILEKSKEYAMILAFDVKIDRDAEDLAKQLNIKIFAANIIYHLFDAFKSHQEEMLELKRKEGQSKAVYPCVLKTLAAFNKKDPIILGVDVTDGTLRMGTPICAIRSGPEGINIIELGRVISIESNHKPLDKVKKGQAGGGVAIKLESDDQILFGRQIDESDTLFSHISRETINTLKDTAFRSTVTKEDWELIIKLKPKFGIV